ncbi:MAG: CHAD domain-containing protein, partial [Candidatus Korobacteraceae bacterium]
LKVEAGARDKARVLQSLEQARARQSKKLEKLLEETPRRTLEKTLAQSLSITSGQMRQSREQRAVWFTEALDQFLTASRQRQPLTEANLHDFRMDTKRARYRAEMAVPYPRAQTVVKRLKSIQDATGDWHDWLTLTTAAEKVLPESRPSPLLTALRAQTHARFLHALETIAQVQRALAVMPNVTQRKPAAAEPQAKTAVA